ncbi:MAG: menaquinone biosynthesis family protein [Chthoniobacterales bacterium]
MTDWKSTTLTLGHSPDPDDAFMFYAMAEEKIDLRGYRFQHILQDIQTLNERASRKELHITAVSIHSLAYILKDYALLPSGASMGDGYGPMFIVNAGHGVDADADTETRRNWLRSKKIAIPGKMTSAFLAAQLFLGADFDYVVVPFDQIFDAVRSGAAEVGLIIHEGQLTYKRDGFEKVIDLGEQWKLRTGLPLPLGGNVIRKDIPVAVRRELSDILHESIAFGLKDRAAAVTHSMSHARGMDEPLADEFIGMYVNDYTLDYGDSGRQAIRQFLQEGFAAGLIPQPLALEFVGEEAGV